MAVVIVIPIAPPPSLNAQERMHWAARQELRKQWADAATVAWIQAGRPRFKRPWVLCKLYYPTHRRRDPDNAHAAIKPIIDGLKGKAWPGDDDCSSIVLSVVQLLVDKERPRVEIVMEEADGDGRQDTAS